MSDHAPIASFHQSTRWLAFAWSSREGALGWLKRCEVTPPPDAAAPMMAAAHMRTAPISATRRAPGIRSVAFERNATRPSAAAATRPARNVARRIRPSPVRALSGRLSVVRPWSVSPTSSAGTHASPAISASGSSRPRSSDSASWSSSTATSVSSAPRERASTAPSSSGTTASSAASLTRSAFA